MNDDFRPTAYWDTLQKRAALLQQLRRFFDERGFVEVETPLLSADTVVDRHLDPLKVTLFDDPRTPSVGADYWLQTSPEYGMKRLLAGGATAIYQVTRAFRGGEQGQLHNPEFTIAEWYRVGDGMQEGMRLLSELTDALLDRGLPQTISYREVFLQILDLDAHTAELEQLSQAAHRMKLSIPQGFDVHERDAWLDLLLVECIEPNLGKQQPTILYDYPASQAALAQVRPEDPPVAERFELYVDGIELANGYHELLDAEVLVARSRQANQQRRSDGKPQLPETSRLESAMRHGLPSCAGVALGFDRLVMVALGASRIDQVMAFPTDRA